MMMIIIISVLRLERRRQAPGPARQGPLRGLPDAPELREAPPELGQVAAAEGPRRNLDLN